MSPRTTSAAFRSAVYAQQTGEALLVLLTISHDDLAEPIRVGSDAVDTVSQGRTFIAFPFAMSLPDDRDDQISRATLTIDNVDRRIVEAIRSVSGPPTVEMELVLADTPDLIEAGPFPFNLINASWDALTVEGELGYEVEILNQVYPAHSMTPQHFPGLFS